MSNENHLSPLATAYAQALLELANETKSAGAVGEELTGLGEVMTNVPLLSNVLADPSIGHEERGRLLEATFKGRVSQLLYNFLGVLNVKGRLKELSQIIDAYDFLLDQQEGKVEVDIITAHKLDTAQIEEVRQKVSAAIKRDAVIHPYVDDSIIGGLILRVQDSLIDGSVRGQLNNMKRALLATQPTH
jgi:F-type H+-transporting ATPase subunit delta